MLRINLLPVRQLKKRAKARSQIYSFLLILASVIALCVLVGLWQGKIITSTTADIAQLTKEKESYAPQLKKLEELKKTKEELERKTAVIEKLKKDSSLTVRVLDEVASRVDSDRLWLDSLTQTGNALKLTGISLDNESIAQFMENLKQSEFVQGVELADSSQKKLAGRDLKSFSISCVVAPPGIDLSAETGKAPNAVAGGTAKPAAKKLYI